MPTAKVTTALDQATIKRLNGLAEQLGKTKSEVAREALRQYHQPRVATLSSGKKRTPEGTKIPGLTLAHIH